MTVRSVCGRRLSGGTEGIVCHPAFRCSVCQYWIPSFRRNESASLLIIGIDCWIRAARNVYIQETVNFMRAFERGHAC